MVKQKVCPVHNGICTDEVNWAYPAKDVCEIVRQSQKPTFVTKCPRCMDDLEKRKKLFKRG